MKVKTMAPKEFKKRAQKLVDIIGALDHYNENDYSVAIQCKQHPEIRMNASNMHTLNRLYRKYKRHNQ